MTLVLSICGPDTLWTVVDRRISYLHQPPKDDARKVMLLETADGQAILAYAGLGATAQGTEPADWMSNVLRGRNYPLEASLGVLAEAMERQLPEHLLGLPGRGGKIHTVIASAFLNGKATLFTIDAALSPDRSRGAFRFLRQLQQRPGSPVAVPKRFGLGGTGGDYLRQDLRWVRPLLHLVKAVDAGKLNPFVVADELARLSFGVHLAVPDTVGPNSIVVWRHRRESLLKGGGAHQFYEGLRRAGATSLPSIGLGMDTEAMMFAMLPLVMKQSAAILRGETVDVGIEAELNAVFALLPDQPDETLR